MTDDHRTEALAHAETSEDYAAMGLVHALLYVGDNLADLCEEVSTVGTRLGDLTEVGKDGAMTTAAIHTQLTNLGRTIKLATSSTPKLAALLDRGTPFVPEVEEPGDQAEPEEAADAPAQTTNGQPVGTVTVPKFVAKHDCADWKKLDDGTGRWESPTGRKYGPYSRQVIGVVRARMKRNLPI